MTNSSQMEIKTESQSIPLRSATKNTIIADDDSDENQPPRLGKRKAASLIQTTNTKVPSRSGSRAPSTRAGSKPPSRASSAVPPTHPIPKPSKQALFLDSDDDIQEVDEVQPENNFKGGDEDEDEEEQTLRSSGTSRRPASSMERPKRIATATVANRRTRRGTAAFADDDSDDGAVFKGFGKGRRGR